MLLKGINKRVIIVKTPNSEMFEEAYFFVKSGKGLFKAPKPSDMVEEANKIITEYHSQQKNKLNSNDSFYNDDILMQNDTIKSKSIEIDDEIMDNIIKKSFEKPAINYDEIDEFDNECFDGNITKNEKSFSPKKMFFSLPHSDSEENSFKKDIKSAFKLLSAKKIKFSKYDISLKSFLFGIVCMSAFVVVFKIVESFMI